MKGIKSVSLLTIILSALFFAIGCRHEIPVADTGGAGGTPPTQTSNCSADTVYFANDILPMINSNCATTGCHDAITHKEGVTLTNYNNIRGYVKPFNAGGSKLYEVCIKSGDERMPQPPLPALTQAQLAKMIKWINQGALNNQCTGGCDSTVFTYAAAVSVTVNTFCKGCHNPASLGGGVDLSTYTGVKTQALNGKLMGSIAHTAGFKAMPQGTNKLSDCQIRQVQKWIQGGSLNN